MQAAANGNRDLVEIFINDPKATPKRVAEALYHAIMNMQILGSGGRHYETTIAYLLSHPKMSTSTDDNWLLGNLINHTRHHDYPVVEDKIRMLLADTAVRARIELPIDWANTPTWSENLVGDREVNFVRGPDIRDFTPLN